MLSSLASMHVAHANLTKMFFVRSNKLIKSTPERNIILTTIFNFSKNFPKLQFANNVEALVLKFTDCAVNVYSETDRRPTLILTFIPYPIYPNPTPLSHAPKPRLYAIPLIFAPNLRPKPTSLTLRP